jgi:O-acetyl-ADP-ribose deacetylase (regulator of RNase III)
MSEIKNTFLYGRVTVVGGDIARQEVDAVVNAANSSLLGGGGVDGAIHWAGGPAILEACKAIRQNEWPDGLPAGEAVITTGGNLPARFVIHTVGPIYPRAGEQAAELLAACYRNSLGLAVERGLGTVAFPAISTGAFAYPQDEAAAVSSRAIMDFLKIDNSLDEVRLVFFSRGDAAVFLKNQRFGDKR